MADGREGKLLRAFSQAKVAPLKSRMSLGLKAASNTHSTKSVHSYLTSSNPQSKHIRTPVPPAELLLAQHTRKTSPRLKRDGKQRSVHSLSLSFQRTSPAQGSTVILCSSLNSFPLSFLSLKKHPQSRFTTAAKPGTVEPCVATVNFSCSLPKLQSRTEPLVPVVSKPARKAKLRPFKVTHEPTREIAEDLFSLSSWQGDTLDI